MIDGRYVQLDPRALDGQSWRTGVDPADDRGRLQRCLAVLFVRQVEDDGVAGPDVRPSLQGELELPLLRWILLGEAGAARAAHVEVRISRERLERLELDQPVGRAQECHVRIL